MNQPLISALCVTRGDRPALLAEALSDFARQTWLHRELLLLHDGGAATHQTLLDLAAPHAAACCIRVEAAPPGLTLGALRNRAVALAQGDWVCQWDDDDRYHPQRLALQMNAAQAEGAAVCCLVDQLHWFRADGLLCWDDWHGEPYPMNLIQGTLLARRDVLPPYPDLARGEDTPHLHALLRAAQEQGFKVARLRGAGWCYVYSFHGANAWEASHHRAISQAKHLPAQRLLPLLALLRERLADYQQPALPALSMPVGAQTVRFDAVVRARCHSG